MARPRSALTKFILSLPHGLPLKEVIARAKAKGMKASGNNVYRIRRTFGAKVAKTAPSKPTATGTSKPAASPTSNPKPASKSDFIRQQPASLSAAEVVAKAKAAGIKLDSFLVYKVRSRAGAKGKRKNIAKKTSTSATVAVSKKPVKSKADFVRAHSSLSPKEVVAKAKTEGVEFGTQYVYRVRALDKVPTKKRASTKRPTSMPRSNGARPTATSSSAEQLLRAVASELGLGRAVEILTGERSRVRSILKGR